MRTLIAIILLVIAGAAAAWVMFFSSPRSPVDFKVVSSKSIGAVNRKEFMLVTMSISNRTSETFVSYPVEVMQAKFDGHWIEVDQSFVFDRIRTGEKLQKRFSLPAGATACRLRFNYTFVDYQSETWMARLLNSLGPMARRLVWRSAPWLRKQVWPRDYEPEWKEITLDVKIPQDAPKSTSWNDPLTFVPLIAPA